MSNIDQDFVEYVVKSLVGNPAAVSIDRKIDEKGVLLTLTVDPDDLGRVIGKRGATAQSIRTLLRALGTKNDARYNLKIADNGPDDRRDSRSEGSSSPAKDDGVGSQTDDSTSSTGSAFADDNDDDQQATSTDEAPQDEEESVVDKTRKELADLDDLDI